MLHSQFVVVQYIQTTIIYPINIYSVKPHELLLSLKQDSNCSYEGCDYYSHCMDMLFSGRSLCSTSCNTVGMLE